MKKYRPLKKTQSDNWKVLNNKKTPLSKFRKWSLCLSSVGLSNVDLLYPRKWSRLFDDNLFYEWLVETFYIEFHLGYSFLCGRLQSGETFAEIGLQLGGSP